MNGRNKYWREARWDKRQPERLAHIKEKRWKKEAESHRVRDTTTRRDES